MNGIDTSTNPHLIRVMYEYRDTSWSCVFLRLDSLSGPKTQGYGEGPTMAAALHAAILDAEAKSQGRQSPGTHWLQEELPL